MNQSSAAPSPTQPTSPAEATPTQAPTVEERSTEFVAVQGGTETTSASALLIAAYVVMWALVFGFVWLTSRKQRTLDARLSELEAALRRVESGPGASTSQS
jgi:CcmD family protein